MPRPILDESRIHPAIRGQNPMPRKARRLLDAANVPYRYLEYGSYLNNWRKRNAPKLWTGWPTFPMVA